MTDQKLIAQHQPDAIRKRLSNKPKGQYVSDAVLGGIDGCITTFSVVSGSVGAGFPSSVALILGFANLVADGFSMAVSNFESSKAEQEFVANIRAAEEKHIREVPEGEREEVRQIYREKGFENDLLENVVNTITSDKRIWLEVMLAEEHGLSKISLNPLISSGVTFLSFTAVGSIPLLPYLIPGFDSDAQFTSSAVLAALMFFVIGMLKSIALSKPSILSGLRTLATGGAAAALAYFSAYALRELFNIATL